MAKKFKSTLEMLKEEGRLEGIAEAEKISVGLYKFKLLLNVFKMLPELPPISFADMATLTKLPIPFVEKAKDYYVHKNESGLFELAQQEIFGDIELYEKEKAKLIQIIKESLQ